ncbi:hypothetical protein X798_02969 [Onchocerca flexuosa]|uniref:Uncharacterized protein n=2 Tax=Onchocerca flexuosa TaxID=387005 RepID=A0A183HGN3_9BILA|nr:hypothetical protein X798_02969 [Onchocerca flexuosa]VDO47277.1 unnamed protein product [Onchocerca flexuosa]
MMTIKEVGPSKEQKESINVSNKIGEFLVKEENDVSHFVKEEKIKKPIVGFVGGQRALSRRQSSQMFDGKWQEFSTALPIIGTQSGDNRKKKIS